MPTRIDAGRPNNLVSKLSPWGNSKLFSGQSGITSTVGEMWLRRGKVYPL